MLLSSHAAMLVDLAQSDSLKVEDSICTPLLNKLISDISIISRNLVEIHAKVLSG